MGMQERRSARRYKLALPVEIAWAAPPKAAGQKGGAPPVGQETKVANAHETCIEGERRSSCRQPPLPGYGRVARFNLGYEMKSPVYFGRVFKPLRI